VEGAKFVGAVSQSCKQVHHVNHHYEVILARRKHSDLDRSLDENTDDIVNFSCVFRRWGEYIALALHGHDACESL